MINKNITVSISSRGRHNTTLPLALNSIISQTMLPGYLRLYIDEPGIKIEINPLYQQMLAVCRSKEIGYDIIYTNCGQVANHEDTRTYAKTDFVWRIDDDEVPEADCLFRLWQTIGETNVLGQEVVGAVAPLVLDAQHLTVLPKILDGTMEQIDWPNVQWFLHESSKPMQVEHLHSTFLYRRSCSTPYPILSGRAGHREETFFTHAIHNNGYKLYVDPSAIVWHHKGQSGGIRSWTNKESKDDDRLFEFYLQKNNIHKKHIECVLLSGGLGDALCFRNIILRHKTKRFLLATHYPEVFDGMDVELLNKGQVLMFQNCIHTNVYQWMVDKSWTQPMEHAMEQVYEKLWT